MILRRASSTQQNISTGNHLFGLDSTVIQLPEPIAAFLRDTCTEEREAYLRHHSGAPWCFLTAHDPHGEPLGYEENAKRTRQTVEYVRLLGCKAVMRQNRGSPAWLPLGGVLIIGIADRDARLLGRNLGQNAIIVGSADSCTVLYDRPIGNSQQA